MVLALIVAGVLFFQVPWRFVSLGNPALAGLPVSSIVAAVFLFLAFLAFVTAELKRRAWSRQHEIGWTARQYRRKLGCSVALDATHGYDMTIGGFWVEGEPDGEPGRWDVVGTSEVRLLLPWNQ